MKEKVSVIMACYNCEDTLQRAIDSILNQSYKDWILICCDDGSTDNTWKILNNNRGKYPEKFILIQNEENRKLPYSLNRCLEKVQTEYVARMDADDWSHPERLERQVSFLQTHPEYDLVGTGISVSDGTKEVASMVRIEKPSKETMKHQYGAFSHATILTYKRVYDALNGYSLDPNVIRCEDIDLWCRFMAAGFRGYNLADKLYVVTEDDSVFKRKNSGTEAIKSRIRFARTLSHGYRTMGFKGFIVYKPYLSIGKAFVPSFVYKAVHIRKLNRGAENI